MEQSKPRSVRLPASLLAAPLPRPVRVAHVVLGLQIGGMEKLLVEMARHVDQERFQFYFVSLGPRATLAEEIEAAGCPVAFLDLPQGLHPTAPFRLAKRLRSWGIDVVHAHNHPAYIYSAPAARLAGIPAIIQTRHGQMEAAPNPKQQWLIRLLTLLADRVVCVSDDSTALAIREGLPRRQVCRIWNGIDLRRFGYLGPQQDGPVVMVARLSPEKDAETLIRAVGLLAPRHPHLCLEIAGDGACRPGLEQLAGALNLSQQIRFLGAVRDVPAVLSKAQLFVLPSLTEGISLTLLEAMARGLPVVATRVGGTPEVVEEGRTGFLVPPRSPAELAEKMHLVLSQPDLGRQLGQAGRRRVEQNFDVTSMLCQYEELYDELLRGRLARKGRKARGLVGK